MKVGLFLAVIVTFASLPNVGLADQTCTAPGHPSCTITCPNGCIAGYTEPSGPCRTQCSGSASTGRSVDIEARGAFASHIRKFLGKR
jgi:hypothetical protein